MFRAFQHRAYAAVLLDAGMDAMLGFLAVLMAAWTISAVPMSEFGQTLSNPSVMFAALGFAICMAMLQSFLGLYRQAGLSFVSQLVRLLVALGIGGYLTYLVLKEVGFDGHPSRLVGYSVLNLVIAILVVRGTIMLVRTAQGSSRVLIVGTGTDAVSVAEDLRRSSRLTGKWSASTRRRPWRPIRTSMASCSWMPGFRWTSWFVTWESIRSSLPRASSAVAPCRWISSSFAVPWAFR